MYQLVFSVSRMLCRTWLLIKKKFKLKCRRTADQSNRLPTITSANIEDIKEESGTWIIVDIGFAKSGNRTCGIAINRSDPEEVEFGDMVRRVLEEINNASGPINLLIEAPLSVSFDATGNPKGRSIERRGQRTRYWYVGAGCVVMTAATYLLHRIASLEANVAVRLIEGFASFRNRSARHPSAHASDVEKLRHLAWNWQDNTSLGRVIPARDLSTDHSDRLVSAFKVAGMDFGIPPVVLLN